MARNAPKEIQGNDPTITQKVRQTYLADVGKIMKGLYKLDPCRFLTRNPTLDEQVMLAAHGVAATSVRSSLVDCRFSNNNKPVLYVRYIQHEPIDHTRKARERRKAESKQ